MIYNIKCEWYIWLKPRACSNYLVIGYIRTPTPILCTVGSVGGDRVCWVRQLQGLVSSTTAWGRSGGGGGGPREPTGKGYLHGDGYRHHHAKTRGPQGECLLFTHMHTGCGLSIPDYHAARLWYL